MSPRTLAALILLSVGLLGLALWEVLGPRTTQPAVRATQGGGDESAPDDEPSPGAGARGERRMVRKIPRAPAPTQVAPGGVGTTTESNGGPRPQGAEGGDGAQAPTLAEAREGFDFVMEELARLAKRRRRISQEQWERHYREANDAFAALSEQLRTEDEKERAELEDAHRLLKERLDRVRVRGKKHKAPRSWDRLGRKRERARTMCNTAGAMRARLGTWLLMAPLLACEPAYGKGERGTTRHCAPEGGTQLEHACYRQCADPAEPSCKVVRKDGDGNPEVPECLRDGSGAYLVEADEFVPPSGSDECFTVLDDVDGSSDATVDDLSGACLDVGANLEFVLARRASATVADGVCYDFNCKLSPDADADCPDLE